MYDALDLNIIWFLLVGILLTGYAILDGFDLGVGALHLFAKTDEERRIFLNAIGPVWDGNEVWLVTGGGALFAAFPDVYATAFSGFYIALMLVLVSLIFRAVAIEFRSKQPMHWWRQGWDISFFLSSISATLIFGVALGNVAQGIPIDANMEFSGSFLSLLNPYALLVAFTTLALFMMHSNIYLVMKTEGALHDRVRGWVKHTMAGFMVMYVATTMVTLLYVPTMVDHIKAQPLFFGLAVFNLLAIANIPRELNKKRDFQAFLSSSLSIVFLMGLFGFEMFPNLLLSTTNPAYSLTIYNAASSQKTLGIMLTVAILGIPLVLAYTACIYWIFRGKVTLDEHHSY